MNRERLTILRDHIATIPAKQFDMADWDCGTAACIGGWCERLWPEDTASESLGLTVRQENALFYVQRDGSFGEGKYLEYSEIDQEAAVSAIQSLIDATDAEALPVWPERAPA